MKKIQINVLSEASNYAIVQMPGRHFPGCVIQGDSLSILVSTAKRIVELAQVTKNKELCDEADELCQALTGRLEHYESALAANGLKLPYSRPTA